ncbi:hypothetical protein JCM16816_24230 [Thermoanaerobacter brockii subsp. lactiethylicus]|uniref:Uncharacterized protein n=1 Tax=Thermoanaerobacter brockii subsp. finnii (strain ATCC 43586 / DSM 3389 / AKO-1) TaxID=509193 RepID=E8UTA6_THEBF|nr:MULTISPECIES: hypothetical protein [Thermoanaerobacter]ADV78715.1 hypothetical protein Thebr_0083 [Thermoanaerobacter brockii subsp. finnii Ako-1]
MGKRIRDEEELNYKNVWELMKQMVDYYTSEKKYLTRREIKYIIRVCESGQPSIPIKER